MPLFFFANGTCFLRSQKPLSPGRVWDPETSFTACGEEPSQAPFPFWVQQRRRGAHSLGTCVSQSCGPFRKGLIPVSGHYAACPPCAQAWSFQEKPLHVPSRPQRLQVHEVPFCHQPPESILKLPSDVPPWHLTEALSTSRGVSSHHTRSVSSCLGPAARHLCRFCRGTCSCTSSLWPRPQPRPGPGWPGR